MSQQPHYVALHPGDPFPWVSQRTDDQSKCRPDGMAGRYLVFCFFGSAANSRARTAIDATLRLRDVFDDRRFSFFGISIDPGDEKEARVRGSLPGVRFMWDFDGAVSRQCGAVPTATTGGSKPFVQFWLVVDPTLHVLAKFAFDSTDKSHERVFAFLRTLPAPSTYAGFELPAPILILPNVFEQDLCRALIDLYDRTGGKESGVMHGGKVVLDPTFKRRKDCEVKDPKLIASVRHRIERRVFPEVSRLFFMRLSHIERYIIGCYAAEDGGRFRPHRDNGPGVQHRRYAVSINLNDQFEGGTVSFPEYSITSYKAPPGWAVVFPCAILHAVSEVTKGKRYAFLPFVFDEEGERIRKNSVEKAGSVQA